MKDGAGDEHTNSSKDVTDEDVERVASDPADAPPPLCRGMCPNLLRPRKVYCPRRQANLRERS